MTKELLQEIGTKNKMYRTWKTTSEIEQKMTAIADYTQYISTPLTETKLQLKCITNNDTQRAIDKLENKSSSGHDGISNKLLKLLRLKLAKQ